MSIRVKGTTNLQEVDSNGNAYTNLPMTSKQSGFASLFSEVDAGTQTGNRYGKELEATDDYRLRVGVDSVIFSGDFVGSAINTALWQTTLNVMTNTVVSGFSQLNAGLSVASGSYAIQRTYRHFPCMKQFTTFAEMEVQFTQSPQTGNRCEWGFALAATTAAPTDGVYFRVNETGTFQCVLNYNGTETIGTLGGSFNFSTLCPLNTTHSYLIYVNSTAATFWIDNLMICEIEAPVGQASSTSSMNLPLLFRNYNTSATSVAQVMKIGQTSVVLADQANAKPWGHVMAGMGAHCSQGQTGGTIGTTAQITNAAAAAAAALTNTSAAAQFIGLGGIFNVLPTLATLDGILCSYQVPVGTSILPGKSLYVTGLHLDGVVTTVLAGGPVIYTVGVAYGHTAVSLATTESATGKAPRKVAVGMLQYAATAPVNARDAAIDIDFAQSPIVVQPGEYFQVTLRNVGTVTTTGAITFAVNVKGHFE